MHSISITKNKLVLALFLSTALLSSCEKNSETISLENAQIEIENELNSEGVSNKYDLELTLKGYNKNQIINTGNVDFEFVIKNVGTSKIPAGSKVYVSLKINDTTQFDLTLANAGEDAATAIDISEDLLPNEFITYKQEPTSFLNVESTLLFLGTTSAEICSILWGVNESSIGTFDSELDSINNTFCLSFQTK